LLPQTNAISGEVGFRSWRVSSMGSVQDRRRVILGVMSPWIRSNSSKNSFTLSDSGSVPPYSAVPPGMLGAGVQLTLVVWVNVYSVGLNMHSIGLASLGLMSLTTTSWAFLGLISPTASPTAEAADPTASRTIARPQKLVTAAPAVSAPAAAPPR